jgi:hypothetical protein
MKCVSCGRDINAIGQDNMSFTPGRPLCEDCYYANNSKEFNALESSKEDPRRMAKEMFEQLGYERGDYEGYILYGSVHQVIEFNFGTRNYNIIPEEGRMSVINPKDHLAITQQLKELGWI